MLDYGHLRPLTYSIASKNYKEGFNHYFSNKILNTTSVLKKDFKISNKLNNKISNIFKKEKLAVNFKEFIKLLQKSIEYREYSKFIFSKSINSVFENLIKFTEKLDINREGIKFNVINEYNALVRTLGP